MIIPCVGLALALSNEIAAVWKVVDGGAVSFMLFGWADGE
jgi:hypothetical protein